MQAYLAGVYVTGFVAGQKITVRAVPNASRSRIVSSGETMKVALAAAPEKGKANQELVKLFRKQLGVRVRIVSGLRSREKVVEVC